MREEQRGSSVKVLCVHPGGIRTNIARGGRMVDVSMVADSPEALVTQFEQEARTSPEQAAAAIVRAICKGKTRLLIGFDARVLDWLYRLFPSRVSPWFFTLIRWMRKHRTA